MQVGIGSLRYELVKGWEKLPAGYSHADVAGVCTDKSGNVYLYCRGELPMMVYDREGNFLDGWGQGKFSYRTHGMFMTQSQELFLVDDGGHSVGRYALDGTLLQQLGPAGTPSDTGWTRDNWTVLKSAGPYNRPTNVGVAGCGDIYVSDGYANSRVHRFSGGGDLLDSWGEPGGGHGQFRNPHSIWVLSDGRVLVGDRQNERIQIFDPQGRYLSSLNDVQRPQDLFVDEAAGLIYIAELAWAPGDVAPQRGLITKHIPSRLSILDLDGNLQLRWSDPDLTKDGYFFAPHSIWVDDEGSIYLAEVTHTFATWFLPGQGYENGKTLQKFARI